MASQVDGGFMTRIAGEALAYGRCVRLNASQQFVYTDDEEEILGVTQQAAASGDNCVIKLLNAEGTFLIEASATVTFAVSSDERGGLLYVDNDGKVSGTGTLQKFVALHGGAAGEYIECYPVPNPYNA